MEFLRFIFSDFWVWLGFMLLVYTIGGGVIELVKTCKRDRMITAYCIGERWHITVENASKEDVREALISVAYDPYEPGEDAGDGRAAYPISGMPYMEKDNICAMFDITEKKCEKLIFHHSDALENISWEDTDPMEQELDAPKLHVCHEGRELLPLQTSDGITFIQVKYLAPLGNPDYMRLYERKDKEGGVYIAVKIGMMIQAVIMPVDIVTEQFVDKMEKLTSHCRAALLKKNRMRARAKEEAGQSTLFREDESAGEVAEE